MKKAIRIALITSLTFILLGGGMMIGGWLLGGEHGFKDVDLNTMRKYHITEKSFDEEIKNVEVDVNRYPVSFKKSDDDRVRVKIRAKNDKDINLTHKGDKLQIKEANSSSKHTDADLNLIGDIFHVHPGEDIVVYLPEKDYDKVMINGVGGYINIDKVSIKNLEIDFAAGDIKIKKSGISGGKIKADTGSVEVEGSVLSDVNIDTGAGDIEIETSELKNVNLKADVGNVGLDRIKYDGGSISIDIGDLDEDNVKYISPVHKKVSFSDDDE